MKNKTLQKIVLAIPVLILAGFLLSFGPNSGKLKTTNPDNEQELFIDYIPYYWDNSKKLIRLVWRHENLDVQKYILEKSVHNGEWVSIAEINAEIMQPVNWNNTPEEHRFGRIMYSTDGEGGFIYNELMDNGEFEFRANFKFRVRAEKKNNTGIVYTTSVAYESKPPAQSVQGLRGPCPTAGSAPKGACVTGTTTTACDCGGSYETSTYVICDNAQACPDCSCSCQCTRDPCCQHSCGQASSCNCTGKWWSCDGGKGSWVSKVTTASCSAPSLSTSVTDQGCTCTGAINLTATSTCTPLSYSWSNGKTSEDQSNICAGTYTVTVTDNCGTTSKTSATVKTTACVAPSLSTAVTDATCSCDGAIDLTATSSCTPLSYSWSTKSTSQDVSGLCAATYTVTVTDACGTTAKTSATIKSTVTVPSLSSTVTNASCICIGAVDLSVSGGTSPYSYSWSTGAKTQDIGSTLCAASYTVTVTDACAQTATHKATVGTSTPTPSVSNSAGDPTGCNCDGSVTANATGGTPSYTYKWSTGSTAGNIGSLCAGSYTVTITDACAKTATASTTLAGCTPPGGTVSVTDAACGSSTGAVDLTYVAGSCGSKVKSFSWSNKATSEDITSLAAGSYTVTVTDKAGCTGTVKATVGTGGAAPTCSAVTTDCSSCSSSCDGSINLSVAGGTPGYTYNWSTGAKTQDISGLCAGSYTVTITDAAGCSIVCDPGLNGWTGILPIEILKFTAVLKDKAVVIAWSTSTEVNSNYFTVEKSQDGTSFNSIEKVKAAGNSVQLKNYTVVDKEPFNGQSYYRLKQTSLNDNSIYSNIVTVNLHLKNIFTVLPNIVQDKAEITFSAEKEEIEISITDVGGKEVYKKTFTGINGIHKTEVDMSSFSNGVYYVFLKNSMEKLSQKIVKY